jgi:hypothetical protein
MNVLEARIVLRDRSFLDVIDLAVRFTVRHGRAYARLAALVLPLGYLVTWGVAAVGGWTSAWLTALVLAPLAAAPFTALASKLLFEDDTSVYEVLALTVSAAPRLVAARLLEALALAAGATCLLVPAVWVLGVAFYLNEVIVLERAPLSAAVVRGQRLLSGQPTEVFLGLLGLWPLLALAVLQGDVVGRSLLEDLFQVTAPPSIFEARGSAIGLAAFWLYVPFEATCRFLLYVNGRTRTEGWDVQTRFTAIAARASADRESLRPGRAA